MTGVKRWGISLYPVSSTRLGSTRINFTSFGEARKRIEARNELIATDFPEPVAPAINKCGIFAISASTGSPATFSPSPTISLDFAFFIISLVKIVLMVTNSGDLFGISIPTSARPGIGASIRICPVGAANANAKSLDKAVILESFVPKEISNAYCVTAGPRLTSRTFALIPNDSSVRSIMLAFNFTSPRSA